MSTLFLCVCSHTSVVGLTPVSSNLISESCRVTSVMFLMSIFKRRRYKSDPKNFKSLRRLPHNLEARHCLCDRWLSSWKGSYSKERYLRPCFWLLYWWNSLISSRLDFPQDSHAERRKSMVLDRGEICLLERDFKGLTDFSDHCCGLCSYTL